MSCLYILHKRLLLCLILICAMLIYNKNSLSQPFSSLINKILLQDESINSSKTLIEKNRNDLSSIKSLYTPKLNFSVPVGREILVNNDAANTDLNYYELDAKISQNIYDFGATSSKIEIAKNQLNLSEVSSENVKSGKILEALSAYLNYMKAFNVLQYAEESENRIKSVTRLENEKVSRGAGLASNVLQSKARLAGARSTRVKFEGDLAIAKNRFFNVFRENPQSFSTFKEPLLPLNLLPSSEEEAIKIARENNIALKVSKLNLKNSKTRIKGSKAKFLPSLKAVAQYKNKRNVSGLDGTEIDHTYKLEMNYPISIGGPFGLFYKENADYKSSMNQYMITKYSHEQLERNLEESVRNSWQTKKIAKQNFDFLENQANISGEFFDLAMKEVKLGNRQLIDILSSETAFINAKSASENAKTEYQLAIYQLLFSIGILNENIFNIEKENAAISEKKTNKRKKNTNVKNIKSNKKISLSKVITNKEEIKESKPINIIGTNKSLSKDSLKKSKPIDLIKRNDDLINEEKNVLKSVNKINSHVSENKFNEKDKSIDIPNSKIYKVQIGAFGKLKNANNYLDKIEIIDFKQIKFSIEEDLSSGLFRIKSINSFSKDQGEKVCKNYRKVKVNCILSKI